MQNLWNVVEMRTNIRKATKRAVSATVAVSIITVMFLALFPAAAGPGPIGATVTGTVNDVNDGEPIEGALVAIAYHEIERSVITDATGKYTIMNVPECYCLKNMRVTKDGYRPESREVAVSGVTVVDFQLLLMEKEPFMGSIVGTVTDDHDGKALEGVRILLEYHETSRETYTDPAGEYAFTEVPECLCLKKVTATLEHYQLRTQEVGVSGVTVVDFQLLIAEQSPDHGTLWGTVLDAETGEPIPGAAVEVTHKGRIWSDVTDDAGAYHITGIPMCRCMKDVTFSADGYKAQKGSVAIGQDTEMNIALEPEESQEPPAPNLPIRKAPESMRDRPYAMAGLVAAGAGIGGLGFYAFMARE